MSAPTYTKYMKAMEELVMIPCSMCDHVHGAHTWNMGCVGVTILNMMGFWTPHRPCDCPGFLSFQVLQSGHGKEESKAK